MATGFWERRRQRKYLRKAERGEAPWGRVGMPVAATVSIKVTRADGTVEDMGTFPANLEDVWPPS